MKKSKKILIGILILIGIVLIELLSYKFALVQYNKPESGKGYKTFENIGDKIEVKNINNTNNVKTYLDIIYPAFSDNFQFAKDKSNNKNSSYYLYDANDSYTLLAGYTVGTATNYYDALVTDSAGKIVNKNKKLLDTYNISDNFDVVDYLVNHYKDKVNIFSSKNNINIHYLMNSYANSLKEGKIRYIEGDLEGFMIISNDGASLEVNLVRNDELYYFSFVNGSNNNYFTEESVIGFLNSISFK